MQHQNSLLNANLCTTMANIRKRSQLTNDSFLKNAVETFQSIASQPNDEYDNFGSSISSQLRSMPLPDALELQADIQHMISMHRIQLFRHSHTSLSTAQNSQMCPSPSESYSSSSPHNPSPVFSNCNTLQSANVTSQPTIHSGDILAEALHFADLE